MAGDPGGLAVGTGAPVAGDPAGPVAPGRDLRRFQEAPADPEACRGRALSAVREAAAAYADGVGSSGSVIVAQVRSAAIDLVGATGVPNAEARRLVRAAGGQNPSHG